MALRMDKRQDYRIVFTGYGKPIVDRAVRALSRRSGEHGVALRGDPAYTDWRRVRGHPVLHGCVDGAVTVVLPVHGQLDSMKSLIRTKTPHGVQIELLRHAE